MYQEKVNMEQGIRPIGELLTDRSFLMPKTTRSGKNEQPEIMKNQWRNFIMAFRIILNCFEAWGRRKSCHRERRI